MKQCATCKTYKEEEDFAWNNKLLHIRHKQCRECMSRFNKESYERHTERHKARVAKTKAQRKQIAKEYVWNYLANTGCAVCGESDPRVLEFHHRDPRSKKYNISEMTTGGYAIETIQAEIAKCEVLCLNHHRLRTYDERGWFKG